MKTLIIAVLAVLIISGCGDDKSSSVVGNNVSTDNPVVVITDTESVNEITGKFIDSPVSNLAYSCSSGITGITDGQGYYTCNVEDTVTFSIGNLVLGTTDAMEVITPTILSNGNSIVATNIAQVLQTLDSDNNPSNGITLNDALVSSLSETSVLITDSDFDDVLVSYTGINTVTEDNAVEHLNASMAEIGFDGVDVVVPTIVVELTESLVVEENTSIVQDDEVVTAVDVETAVQVEEEVIEDIVVTNTIPTVVEEEVISIPTIVNTTPTAVTVTTTTISTVTVPTVVVTPVPDTVVEEVTSEEVEVVIPEVIAEETVVDVEVVEIVDANDTNTTEIVLTDEEVYTPTDPATDDPFIEEVVIVDTVEPEITEEEPIVPVEVVGNGVVLTLNTYLPDTDNDGMTDTYEVKYGFDPYDASSFPSVPELVIQEAGPDVLQIDFVNELNATYTDNGFVLVWETNSSVLTSLILYNGDDRIVYGGNSIGYMDISYGTYNLTGSEVLTGRLAYSSTVDGTYLGESTEFTLDLSLLDMPVTRSLLDSSNRISFTYKDFTNENKEIYNNFLSRVWPIMLDRLGTPAENFNCVITNMGESSSYFMIVDDGRTFLSTQEFYPRLIVHEFIHAWKGKYGITVDANNNYDDALSGFEEGLAEGLAFEIIHDYTKAYPNDYATDLLLSYKPYQYHSVDTTHYDVIKTQRNTTAGGFWTAPGSYIYRYGAASVTIQNIIKEYPNFFIETQRAIYQAIEADNNWYPTRDRIMAIWHDYAPTVQGIDLVPYLNALPVFHGSAKDDGFYIQTAIRHYGGFGDQQFSIAYALDGNEQWFLRVDDILSAIIPTNVNYFEGSDGWVYADMQAQPFSYDVYTDNSIIYNGSSVTDASYENDGRPSSMGWSMPNDLQQDKFDIGMYRETVTFNNFADYAGATESFYFFGYNDYTIEDNETVIMVGIDAMVTDANVTINLDGLEVTTPVVRSLGLFKFSNQIPKGYEGSISITVDSNEGTCSYTRTLLDAGTRWFKSEFAYVIVDKDFNCIEDIYE